MKLKYIAIIEQCGEGCDYTVGCGWTYKKLSAQDLEGAKKEIETIIEEHPQGTEWELEKIQLFEIANHWNVDVESKYNQIKGIEELVESIKKEEAEKKLYQELKSKYG